MAENVGVFLYVNNCFKEDSHHLFSMATVRRVKKHQHHSQENKVKLCFGN